MQGLLLPLTLAFLLLFSCSASAAAARNCSLSANPWTLEFERSIAVPPLNYTILNSALPTVGDLPLTFA